MPVGVVVAGLVALSSMALVLHAVDAWPFARPEASRPVPGARLPLPPSAVGSGVTPPDGPQGGGAMGGPGMGSPGMGSPGMSGRGMSGGMGMAPGGPGGAGDCGCTATWHVDAQGEDFRATVRVTATTATAVRGWRVSWRWADGRRLVEGWNGAFRASGTSVSVRGREGRMRIPPGGTTTFGLRATGTGSPAPRLTCRTL